MNEQEPTLMQEAMAETAKDLRSIAERPVSPPEEELDNGHENTLTWDCTLPEPLAAWTIENAVFAYDRDDQCWDLISIEEASFGGGCIDHYCTESQIDALFLHGKSSLRDLLEEQAGEKWEAGK